MASAHALDEVKRQIRVYGQEDWLMLYEVAAYAADASGSADWRIWRELGIQAIEELFREGLLRLGTPSTRSAGFGYWTCPLDESLRFIRDEWEAYSGGLNLGDGTTWLDLTPEGAARGAALQQDSD